MRWKDYINAEEVRRALSIFQEPGAVFEIRAIGTAKKDIISGYFRDADTMLAAFDTIDLRKRNVYITLGRVKSECFARAQSERFLKTDQTTSDNEIISYRWLFVDLDPKRMAGISSTNEELAKASELSWKVYEYLKGLGFEEPVRAMSGNGIHLLYRIDIPNDESSKALVEKCLKVIASVFDTEAVNVDTTTYKPSRVCKLPCSEGDVNQRASSPHEHDHTSPGRNQNHRQGRLAKAGG